MKRAKKRTIYSNYDLWRDYAEDAKATCIDNGIENPTENDIWETIYLYDEDTWKFEKEKLVEFFSGGTWIIRGVVGRWDGAYPAGTIFTDFMEMYDKATEDCGYVHVYDKNGHLYLQCSHHDGTNLYEIKKLTAKGEEYLANWEYGTDNRSERYVHDQIMKRYSILPHYAHQVYGCPKVEYESTVA